MRQTFFGLAAALALTAAAGAEEMDHSRMDHAKMDHGAAGSPATEAYKKADMTMHAAMERGFTGDADLDFVTGMIPHHQGAIDMAKVVLRYGKDPEVKRLAQDIVAAQEKEIAEMKAIAERLKKKD